MSQHFSIQIWTSESLWWSSGKDFWEGLCLSFWIWLLMCQCWCDCTLEPRFCHCSPLHPTTLSAATRAAAGIPKSAAHFAWAYPASRIPRCQIRVSCVFQLRMAELGSLDRVLNTWGGQVETSRPLASSGTRTCFLGIWRRLRRIPEISILQKWSWYGVYANMYLASIAMSRLFACLHLLWPEDMFTSTKIATLLGQHPLVSCKRFSVSDVLPLWQKKNHAFRLRLCLHWLRYIADACSNSLFWTLVWDASSTGFYGEIGTSVNGWNWDTGTCGRLPNPRSNERWNRSPFWWLQHPAGDSGRSSFTARLEGNKEISDGLELRLVKVVSIQWLHVSMGFLLGRSIVRNRLNSTVSPLGRLAV